MARGNGQRPEAMDLINTRCRHARKRPTLTHTYTLSLPPPKGFLDRYDPDFICNGSDDSGRYDYKSQPDICRCRGEGRGVVNTSPN